MSETLPNPSFATYQPGKAFSVGPDIEGEALSSGEYFTGRWGLWIYNSEIKYKRVGSIRDGVSFGDIGKKYTGFSQDEIPTSSSKRFQLLSFAFTSSGEPLVAIQDNGDSNEGYNQQPIIKVSYSGDKRAEWYGKNPALFNFAQVNYPESIPNDNYGFYQTGQLACYYYKDESSGLYARYISDGFSTENIIASGLSGGFSTSTRSEAFTSSLGNQYPPYLNTLVSIDSSGGRVRALAQKPYINFASDDFNLNDSGVTNVLESGYGRWAKNGLISKSNGSTYSLDRIFYDTFDTYDTGSRDILNSGTTFDLRSYIGYVTGETYNNDYYMSDDFNTYSSGSVSLLNSGITYSSKILYTGVLTGTFYLTGS